MSMRPCRIAKKTTSTTECAPIFRIRRVRYVSPVFDVTPRIRAVSFVLRPDAMSAATSSSRGDRGSRAGSRGRSSARTGMCRWPRQTRSTARTSVASESDRRTSARAPARAAWCRSSGEARDATITIPGDGVSVRRARAMPRQPGPCRFAPSRATSGRIARPRTTASSPVAASAHTLHSALAVRTVRSPIRAKRSPSAIRIRADDGDMAIPTCHDDASTLQLASRLCNGGRASPVCLPAVGVHRLASSPSRVYPAPFVRVRGRNGTGEVSCEPGGSAAGRYPDRITWGLLGSRVGVRSTRALVQTL